MKIHKKEALNTNTDEMLLIEYQRSGDLQIFAELYLRYNPLVFGLCMKYLKDAEESKDAVMDLFEKISIDLKKHKVQNFRGWLYVNVKNHCLMKIRKDSRTARLDDEREYVLQNIVDFNSIWHPYKEVNDNESSATALGKCMENLIQDQKECIRLFYYEKRSYAQISKLMDLEVKKVKSFIQNGKRNLKICIESMKS